MHHSFNHPDNEARRAQFAANFPHKETNPDISEEDKPDVVWQKKRRDEKREGRESRVNDKREDKQDFKLDKLDAKNDKIHAQAVKAEAVSKKRKWLVFLIAAVMAAAVFFKKYIFGG